MQLTKWFNPAKDIPFRVGVYQCQYWVLKTQAEITTPWECNEKMLIRFARYDYVKKYSLWGKEICFVNGRKVWFCPASTREEAAREKFVSSRQNIWWRGILSWECPYVKK